MELPIDAQKAPYKEKYLDETSVLAQWFEFGKSADGLVDVSDANGDIFTGLLLEDAQRLVAARDVFLGEVFGVLTKLPSLVTNS